MASSYSGILILFTIVTLGVILAKKGLFTEEVGHAFAKFVIDFALPLEIFLRLTRSLDRSRLVDLLKEIILPGLAIILFFVAGAIVAKLLKVKPANIGGFIVCFASPSAAFLGIPIILGIYGDSGLPYALLCYMVTSISSWTVGILLFNRDNNIKNGVKSKLNIIHMVTQIISPPLLAFFFGGLFIWFSWDIPSYFKTLFGYISNTTSPLAMLYIGTSIYLTGFKNLKLNKEVIGVLLGRYVVSPLIVFGLYSVIPVSALMGSVCLIWSSLPVSNSVVIISGDKKIDVGFTDASLSYSVLVYLFVSPLIIELTHLISR